MSRPPNKTIKRASVARETNLPRQGGNDFIMGWLGADGYAGRYVLGTFLPSLKTEDSGKLFWAGPEERSSAKPFAT